MPPQPDRPRRPSYAERRARRAEVDDPGLVLEAAARSLEARPRSAAEVRRRLSDAGYRTELVEQAISRLVELGYLDDEAFGRAWVESRDRAHPRGETALRRELRQKGLEANVVDRLLEERRGDAETRDATVDVDQQAAQRLLERHRRALERVADPRLRRQRGYALLARHGFDPTTASDAARRFLAGTDPTDD